jgi:transcriptional regulator with XRE-family HTH domain
MYFARADAEPQRLRKDASRWLKAQRKHAGLSQVQLATRLGLKYYTFISQVENGFGRVPVSLMEQWALALNHDPTEFARQLILFYDPELSRLLFREKETM